MGKDRHNRSRRAANRRQHNRAKRANRSNPSNRNSTTSVGGGVRFVAPLTPLSIPWSAPVLPAISDYFWAPFALNFFEADIQEHLGWPALFRKAMTAVNEDPDNPTHRFTGVIADRAFTNRSFIGFNTNEGIASITPERLLPGGRDWTSLRDPNGLWDEHSPRCRYCGGPSAAAAGPGEGFALTGTGDPRIAYRCALRWTDDCREDADHFLPTRSPRAASHRSPRPRLPRPAQLPQPVRGRLRRLARPLRRLRHLQRHALQAARVLEAQRLRAAAALLAEWFRICVRQGYIGNHAKRNTNQPRQRTGGTRGAGKVSGHRSQHMLNLPLGPASLTLPFPPAAAASPPPPAAPPPASPPP
jgi:hypothetical protein